MMSQVYAQSVARLLAELNPRSILLLDPHGRALVAPYLEQHPDCALDDLAADDVMAQLRGRGRYGLCFVAGTLEWMDKAAAAQIIARLRDVHAQRLFIVLPVGEGWSGLTSEWTPTDLIAYGLKPAASFVEDGRTLQMYAFDLATYKDTPDWLNATHWAHPERWGKTRW